MNSRDYDLLARAFGVLMIGIAAVLLGAAAAPVETADVFHEFAAFLGGDVPARVGNQWRFETVLAILAIELPTGYFVAMLVVAKYGWPTGTPRSLEATRKVKRILTDRPVLMYFSFFATSYLLMASAGLVEEPLCRWIFGGWLGGSMRDHAVAFLILAHVGNVLFALAHLGNFQDPYPGRFLRILPQFWLGLWCIFVLAKFGLWAAVMLHAGHNVVSHTCTLWSFVRRIRAA